VFLESYFAMLNLSRNYSIASLLGIGLVIIALSVFFRHLALQTLLEHQTRANVDLTRSFANAIWDKFSGFVAYSTFLSSEQIKQRSELKSFHDLTKHQMKGLNVVKVKIYNLDGMTVFSTDPKQIGQDKSQNEGFHQARFGEVASEITFRNQFYSFEHVIVGRNLIASYIPIREDDHGPVKAVFEVYSDVTPLVEKMDATQNKIIIGAFVSLTVLFLFIYIIVRRADSLILKQERARKESEDRMQHQAYHDALTGLPNRNSFTEGCSDAISRAKRHIKNGSLLFIDLDRFKLVNESLGHDAGDQLLRIVASRVEKCLRETEIAYRISGDEFVIILEDMEKGEYAAKAATNVLDAMAIPILLDGYEVIVNVSIGITTFPKRGVDVEDLVKEADVAMRRARETGHNRYEFYTHEMNTVAVDRLSIVTDLQRAWQNNEFLLHYQPKVYSHSMQLAGVEALLRWQHPTRGMIPARDFIHLLEDVGLINAIGEWALLTACKQAQTWIMAGLQPMRISVNISTKQFRNQNLVETVRATLEDSGLDAKYLELELTEGTFIENTQRAIGVMHKLKDLGITLCIDDFGSGYSSLNYLKQFPVDYLKIDKSFVKGLEENNKDAAIIAAIISLAHNLNMGIVAKGVDSVEQMKFLTEKGCQELQGVLFSKPLPAEDIVNLILINKIRAIG
jgi:diguanylate cyclase (GGDEF)-like protein